MVDIDVTIAPSEEINVTTEVAGAIEVTLSGGTTPVRLNNLVDVDITSVTDQQFLKYNSASEQWENTNSTSTTYWGDINGTIANQADLQLELDLKEDNLTFSTGLIRTVDTIIINNSEITLTASQISDFDTEVSNNISVTANTGKISYTDATKVSGIEAGAEVNNISDANAIDLTDGGTTILHSHAAPIISHADLTNVTSSQHHTKYTDAEVEAIVLTHKNIASAHHTKTSTASEITDFDTEVSNNTSVSANTTHSGTVVGNPHSVTKSEVGLGNVPNTDCTNASNISSGTLSSSILPPVAITTVQVVISEEAQLSLTAEEGDVAVRSDENKSYMRNSGSEGTMSDWTELQTPTDYVLSVNSKTGTVVLTTGDITEDTDKNYVTDAEAVVIGNTSGTNTGDETTGNLTEATSSILTIVSGTNSVIGSGTTIEVAQSNSTTSGYLSSTDWNTFNNKTSNVSTDLSEGASTTTTVDVNSSDGTNATLLSASTTRAGLLTKEKFDEIVVNNSKVSNVSTDLSAGTRTSTTIDVNSSDGTNATLVEADTTNAGILGSDKWDEIVANSLKTSYTDAIDVGLNTTHRDSDGKDHSDVVTNNAKVTNASHSGDATGDTILTLATVNSNVGSFTSADITVNEKGLITAVSNGSSSGGITWTEVTGTTQSASVDTGYILNNAVQITVTLPNTASVGSILRLTGLGAGGWKLAQNTSDYIYFGNSTSTTGTGGYLESTHSKDSIELVCVVADTGWSVISSVGNINII